jgi:hypothetical protein
VRGECGKGKKRSCTYLVVMAAVVRSCDVSSVHFLKVFLDWQGQEVGWERLMASWIRGLGSWGVCSEMSKFHIAGCGGVCLGCGFCEA